VSSSFLSSEEFDERAHQLYDAGEYEEALALLGEGLRLYPDAEDLHVGLGYVHLAREEYVWALRSFERGLELNPEHEDGWVGVGEALLKFGRLEQALASFARVDQLGMSQDCELGLAIGRALYREGLLHESRQRLGALARVHRDNAEVRAALGYTLHALGDESGARRELRASLRLQDDLHEVRIYLSHLLFERGDQEGALRELERVPPEEHWDSLSIWRYIELKSSIDGVPEDHSSLGPWRARWEELQSEPDAVDHLLAEVEAAFEENDAEPAPRREEHRVCTADGRSFSGTWEEIVAEMRNELSDPTEPIDTFMQRAAQRVRNLTGCDLPHHDAEAFLRESARIGLLRIED
jgi:Flp pilus assembly protein TadD